MAKERKSNREAKKQPLMTAKERKAAKKAKKEEKSILGSKAPKNSASGNSVT